MLAHVDDSLLLLGTLLVLSYRGVVTGGVGDGAVTPTAAAGLGGAAVVLDVWFVGSRFLHRWAVRPRDGR